MDINSSGKYLFLGGTRSGKSRLAEEIVAGNQGDKCYLATAPRLWIEGDTDFANRVSQHRQRRGSDWTTVELLKPEELYQLVEGAKVPTLLDSIGGWIAGSPGFVPDLARLEQAIRRCNVSFSFVGEEVGLSVHPESAITRNYVDLVGRVNEVIARCVDRVFLVVAGRMLELQAHSHQEEGP